MAQQLSDEYSAIYEQMLDECCATRPKGKQSKLTTFWPIRTTHFQQEKSLLFIGRAVNGWTDSAIDLNGTAPRETATNVLQQAKSSADSRSPLGWLEDSKVGPHNYQPRRSQFWGIVRRVAQNTSDSPWYDAVAWSNLYKIAPHASGNPGDILRKAQAVFAERLLLREIEEWRPARVIFLTGLWWVEQALPNATSLWKRYAPSDVIQAAGDIVGIPAVVANHPQGRRLDEMASALGG